MQATLTLADILLEIQSPQVAEALVHLCMCWYSQLAGDHETIAPQPSPSRASLSQFGTASAHPAGTNSAPPPKDGSHTAPARYWSFHRRSKQDLCNDCLQLFFCLPFLSNLRVRNHNRGCCWRLLGPMQLRFLSKLVDLPILHTTSVFL